MPSAIVAVVTGQRGLSEAARGLLRRCGFVVVEHRSIAETAAAMQRSAAPDYVVLMLDDLGRHEGTDTAAASLTPFLDAIRPILAPDHIVAVCSSRQQTARAITEAQGLGMHVLPSATFSVRRLSRFLMALQGADGSGCCQAASEHPTRGQPSS